MILKNSVYTNVIEAVKNAADIDIIGVVDGVGKTAVSYVGGKVLQKYHGGVQKEAVLMQITGMEDNSRQELLVKKLCAMGERLRAGISAEGAEQPKIKVTAPPVPISHDAHTWIYRMDIQVVFYTKNLNSRRSFLCF